MMTIRSQFTDEEVWTKALKYMLTNLKFLIAWCTKNFGQYSSLSKQTIMFLTENEQISLLKETFLNLKTRMRQHLLTTDYFLN